MATMRAVVQDGYGPPEILRIATVDVPVIEPTEVLVRVRAAAVDRGSCHLLHGRPLLVRLAMGLRRPRRRVPGLDLAGEVVAVGAAVTRFSVGDRVFGIGRGSLAELAPAREGKLAHLPAGCSFTEGATLGISGLTALQAVRDAGRVTAGQHVLVIGASGGVGSFAVQIAKASGATVTGVCRGAKAAFVRELGADHVIDHEREDYAAGPTRYDVVLDIGGRSSLRRLRRALAERGTLVVIGGEGGGPVTGGFGRGFRAQAWSPFLPQRLTNLLAREVAVDLEVLAAMVEAGTLRATIARTFALADVADALRALDAGEARGKFAVDVALDGALDVDVAMDREPAVDRDDRPGSHGLFRGAGPLPVPEAC